MSLGVADDRREATMKVYLPKEHGLWTWVCVPLLAAGLLAPHPATLAGSVALLAGFFAFNAARHAAWGHVAAAGAVATLAGLVTVPLAVRPQVVVGTAVFALAAAAGAAALFGGKLPRVAAFEVGGILALCAMAGGLAVAAGADAGRAAVALIAVATWLVAGLWWVRRLMANVLPKRSPWRVGHVVALALAAISLAVGVAVGEPLVGAVPLLYPLRMFLHRPPARAIEAMKVGLVELAWAVGAAALVGLA